MRALRSVMQVVADGRPGGGTTNVLALTEDLLAAGVAVRLVSQTGSYAVAQACQMGVQVDEVDFFGPRGLLSAPAHLGVLVARHRPDIVHLHGGRAGFLGALDRRIGLRQPVGYTVRGYHFLRKPRFWRSLGVLAQRRASGRADVTIWVCRYDQELAATWGLLPDGKRGIVIRNGVRVADIPPARAPRPRSVGFLGRLTHQKNPQLLIEVARLLKDDGYTFKLIGGGELETALRELVARYSLSGQVEILGSMPRTEALETLRDMETFILPSRWEGLPIAPVEAMAMGVPVIVSDASGNSEIVSDGINGVLVKGEDPRDYAVAIKRIRGDSALRARLIEAGKCVAAERFGRERVIAQHLDLYDQLLGCASDRA
ncbi:MAG: glycosyltransferase [Candidatus Eisenbacteria sp.]|nr:glycosyltransferase [Candidatus Eisenbacteria bacterium]